MLRGRDCMGKAPLLVGGSLPTSSHNETHAAGWFPTTRVGILMHLWGSSALIFL